MPAPITLPPLDEQLQAELHQRYEEAGDAETRTRSQGFTCPILSPPSIFLSITQGDVKVRQYEKDGYSLSSFFWYCSCACLVNSSL
jgi:hypothetical protein